MASAPGQKVQTAMGLARLLACGGSLGVLGTLRLRREISRPASDALRAVGQDIKNRI